MQVRVPERLQPDLWIRWGQSELELRQQVRHGEIQLRAQRQTHGENGNRMPQQQRHPSCLTTHTS